MQNAESVKGPAGRPLLWRLKPELSDTLGLSHALPEGYAAELLPPAVKSPGQAADKGPASTSGLLAPGSLAASPSTAPAKEFLTAKTLEVGDYGDLFELKTQVPRPESLQLMSKTHAVTGTGWSISRWQPEGWTGQGV